MPADYNSPQKTSSDIEGIDGDKHEENTMLRRSTRLRTVPKKYEDYDCG